MDGVNDDRFYVNKFDEYKGESMIRIDGRVREIFCKIFVGNQNILCPKHFEHSTLRLQTFDPKYEQFDYDILFGFLMIICCSRRFIIVSLKTIKTVVCFFFYGHYIIKVDTGRGATLFVIIAVPILLSQMQQIRHHMY